MLVFEFFCDFGKRFRLPIAYTCSGVECFFCGQFM